MTLSGGRPDDLYLSDFLDAGYALLVEAYQSVPGGHLIDAIEKAQEYSEGAEEPEVVAAEREAAKNAAAVAELNSMMAGVQKRR